MNESEQKNQHIFFNSLQVLRGFWDELFWQDANSVIAPLWPKVLGGKDTTEALYRVFKGALHQFYTSRSFYSSRGVQLSVWKQLCNDFCDSGGEKKIHMLWEVRYNAPRALKEAALTLECLTEMVQSCIMGSVRSSVSLNLAYSWFLKWICLSL